MAANFKGLTPETKRKMDMFMRACAAQQNITLKGAGIIITHAVRTAAEQNALWQIGRDSKGRAIGKTVTNAKAGKSMHEIGKAFDICFLINKRASYVGPWEQVGQIGEKCGLEWGGRWTIAKEGIVDKPHFQSNN